jgi:hypothetical protein
VEQLHGFIVFSAFFTSVEALEGCHRVDRQNASDHPRGASRSEEAFSFPRAFWHASDHQSRA